MERLTEIEELAARAGLGEIEVRWGSLARKSPLLVRPEFWADDENRRYFQVYPEASWDEINEGIDPWLVDKPTFQNRLAWPAVHRILDLVDWRTHMGDEPDVAVFERRCLELVKAAMRHSLADRVLVAQLSQTPELLAELAFDDDAAVQFAAVRNPECPSEVLVRLALELDNPDVRKAAAQQALERGDVAEHTKATIALST